MPAAPLAPDLQAKIIDCAARGLNKTEATRETGLNRSTVYKYWPAEPTPRPAAPGYQLGGTYPPDPQPAARPPSPPTQVGALPPGKHDGPDLPPAEPDDYAAHVTTAPGHWLVLGDAHIPYHDRATLELAAAEARRRGVAGVLLNGDILDSHEVSRHDRDPAAPRYVDEVGRGRQFVAWLRGQFPRAEVVFKQGNHEERLDAYIVQRAPALFGLEGFDLPSLLHLTDHGIGYVGGKRIVQLGKLPVVHGHEYRGGGGVNPARWLYLRARYVSLCSHFHRTSEHHERNIRGRAEAAWSLGCACSLAPKYMPLNSWNHGFCFVTVGQDGSFEVDNKRVLGGKVI